MSSEQLPPARVAWRYARHLGWGRTLARACYLTLNRVVDAQVFDCLSMVAGEENEAYVDAGAFEARVLEPDEVGRLTADSGSGLRPLEETKRALCEGDLGYALLASGRPVHVSLFSPRPTRLTGDLYVRFPSPWWYMYGAFTHPDFRGRRLHAVGVVRGFRELQRRGVERMLCVCEWTNYRSRVSAMRMGWQPCGRVWRLGVGGRSRLGASREARAVAMRLEERVAR
ncbi:MAG: hypothetical protein R3190_09260 [Thermoanaerobaculia bacterium]|nr:hypothetical protein [Thermoanaerobaculia bacterium]